MECMELPCFGNFKETNFRATGWKKTLKTKTLIYCNEKKNANCNRNDYVLSRTLCDQTMKIKPIYLEILWILFTVRLQEDILDPVDPE